MNPVGRVADVGSDRYRGPAEPVVVDRDVTQSDDAMFVPGDQPAGQRVPVDELRTGDSPRLAGESASHTRRLAELDVALPPILVHRATMRVIDGMHRLRAAQLRGDQTIDIEFFDGPDHDTFVAAVRSNVAQGLPLTLADREAAAARILASHAQYSDRSIAAITGLAAGTVREIRRRTSSPANWAPTYRVGQDGRARPLDSAQARRLASEAIVERPGASLREIARAAGLSPTTVRDVRERMRRGDDPVPQRGLDARRNRSAARAVAPMGPRAVHDRKPPGGDTPDRPTSASREQLLANLSKDPSLRFTDSGRALLRALFARSTGPPDRQLLESLPPHCTYTVAALAYSCAREWLEFARQLERQPQAGARSADRRPAS